MRVVIAGDREVTDFELVEIAIKKSGFKVTEVVSGKARGADALGEEWALRNFLPIKEFPADWNNIYAENAIIKERYNKFKKKNEKYNANAGFQRNEEMAEYADALIALQPNGDSNGTQDIIRRFKKKGKPLFVLTSQNMNDEKYEYFL